MDEPLARLLGESTPRPHGVFRLRRRVQAEATRTRARNTGIVLVGALAAALLVGLWRPPSSAPPPALLQSGPTVVVAADQRRATALSEVETGRNDVRFYWVGSVGG